MKDEHWRRLRRGGVASPMPRRVLSDYDSCELSILKRPKGAQKLLSQQASAFFFRALHADDRDKFASRAATVFFNALWLVCQNTHGVRCDDNTCEHPRSDPRAETSPKGTPSPSVDLCANLYARSAIQ